MARSATRLNRQAEIFPIALRGLGIFQTSPPAGVRDARRRRRALPAVLRAAAAAGAQRLHPVARRPLRLRGADRRPDRARRCSTPATSPGAPRCRRSTPAPGRCTRAARSRASPTSATTSCCATSWSSCAGARRRSSTAARTQHFTAYLTTPPAVEVLPRTLRPNRTGKLRFKLSKIARVSLRVTRGDDAPWRRSTPACSAAAPRALDLDGAEALRRLRASTVTATDLAGNAASGGAVR